MSDPPRSDQEDYASTPIGRGSHTFVKKDCSRLLLEGANISTCGRSVLLNRTLATSRARHHSTDNPFDGLGSGDALVLAGQSICDDVALALEEDGSQVGVSLDAPQPQLGHLLAE